MKKIFIILFSVLMVAGFTYAAEEEAGTMFDFSGMINTLGVYLDNDNGLQGDKDTFPGKSYDYSYYEMEVDADLKITPSDKTLIFMNMEIHDETFVSSPTDGRDITDEYDDNIEIKRAYGKYSFDNGMSTSFGLMSGGAFGTAFGDNGDGYYRVRLDGAASFGNWGFILEKVKENGIDATANWDAEKDDADAYALYLVTKAGDVTLQFLAKYAQIGEATAIVDGGFEEEGADIDLMAGVVAAMGSHGAIGWEAEFMVLDYAFDGDDIDVGAPNNIAVPEDYTVWGLYGNVWMTMDAVKFGGYFAYGSADDDSGQSFDMGADFYFGQGIGESQSVGGFSYTDFLADGALTSNKGGFKGVTLLGLYADFAVNDALSLYGNFSYWMSNEEKAYNSDVTDADYGEDGDSPWKDATGYELTGVATYKLADNVAYSAGAAYGQMDIDDDEIADADYYVRAFHKIQINF